MRCGSSDVYGDNGFYDAVNIATGEVAKYYLALDQGMVMAALGNVLRHNHLQHYFTKGTIQEKIQPLLEMGSSLPDIEHTWTLSCR